MTAPDGGFLGVQRIYLDPARPAKAPVPDAKKCMGRTYGGAVLLGEPQAETLVVAEGVETALSVLTARPALRAAAALSAGVVGHYIAPEGTVRVLIARDGDAPGAAGAERLWARIDAALSLVPGAVSVIAYMEPFRVRLNGATPCSP